MTFIASANAISLCGAKPVFLDIDPKSYNIDPNLVEKELKKKKKIKAKSKLLLLSTMLAILVIGAHLNI